MPSNLTDEEFTDAISLADNMGNEAIGDELERLAVREREILERLMPSQDPDGSIREITIFNIVILSAAAARVRDKANKSA